MGTARLGLRFIKPVKMENFFDREYYGKWVQNSHPLVRDFLKKEDIFLKKNIKPNSRVLDVGCGYGRTIINIYGIPSQIYGIDNSEVMVDRARADLTDYPDVIISLEDAINMSFEDDFFDHCICAGNTFGNMDYKKIAVLEEMKRVTKRDGSIYISVFSEKSLPFRAASYLKAGMPLEMDDFDDETLVSENGLKLEQFTKEKLAKMFKRINLKYVIENLNEISYICTLFNP